MSEPLKNTVVTFLDDCQLDDDRLAELEALCVTAEETQNSNVIKLPAEGRVTRWLQVCAVAVMVVLAVLLYNDGVDTRQEIVTEVAKNHLHMKPLDISSNKPADVFGYFSLLDFVPAQSSLLAGTGKRLLGGRYCSIKGVTAAQLRYQNSDGQLETLYQVHYDPAVFSELPVLEEGGESVVMYERGLQVTLWVEKDLLMVSAKPASNDF